MRVQFDKIYQQSPTSQPCVGRPDAPQASVPVPLRAEPKCVCGSVLLAVTPAGQTEGCKLQQPKDDLRVALTTADGPPDPPQFTLVHTGTAPNGKGRGMVTFS